MGGGWVGEWLEEFELKQALQCRFGLGVCNTFDNFEFAVNKLFILFFCCGAIC
jgi:hypothetical protein